MNFYMKKFDELTTCELYEILKSRAEIFLLEQRIVCQDLDDVDYKSIHFYILEDKRVIAYLRAFYENDAVIKIGRVLTLNHGQGIGRELFLKVLKKLKPILSVKRYILMLRSRLLAFMKNSALRLRPTSFWKRA